MVTVADLKDQIGVPGPHPKLHCPSCGDDYSANAGDYWNVSETKEFRCDNCGTPLVLAVRRVVYDVVKE